MSETIAWMAGPAEVTDRLLRYRHSLPPISADLPARMNSAVDDTASVREPSVVEARTIVGRYQTNVAGERLFGVIDGNPYAPTEIRMTPPTSLTSLSTAVR